MKPAQSKLLILVGFFLVLAGAVLPFLMVIGVLPASLWLSILSYASSISGMFVGLIGAAYIAAERRRATGGTLLESLSAESDLPVPDEPVAEEPAANNH